MRKTLKFLHEMASIGYLGAILALMVLHASLPEPSDLSRFVTLRVAMGAVAELVLLPSMGLVVVSGLLSIAATRAFHNAAWVWAKLASGILVFEGTLVYVQAPMQRAARQAQAALAGELPVTGLDLPLQAEWASFWILGSVAVANVVLGVWRPRLRRRRKRAEARAAPGRPGAAASAEAVEGRPAA